MKNLLLTPESDVAGWNEQAAAIKAGTFTETPHDLPLGGPATTEAPTGATSALNVPLGAILEAEPRLPGWAEIHLKLVTALIAGGAKPADIDAILPDVDKLADALLKKYVG